MVLLLEKQHFGARAGLAAVAFLIGIIPSAAAAEGRRAVAERHEVCNSIAACQQIAKKQLHKDVLLPKGGTFLGGALSDQGLGMDFRLSSGLPFRTIITTANIRCSDNQIAPTKRRFCYLPFDNGANAIFRAAGLTYYIIIVQGEPPNSKVPRLPQAMEVVVSYGAP